MPDWIEPHQTRLFPKRTGADNTRLSGIAARCDWVLVTDLNRPFTRLIDVTGTRAPRVIFVGLRNAYVALDTLAREILPRLRHPFVLVTGSEDVTVPRQIDSRSRPFDDRERAMIRTILDHPLLRHWFAENLDTAGEPRMSPLPVGFVLPQGAPPEGIAVPRVPPLAGRPARVLVAHRVREDRQWDVRRRVTQLARGAWGTVCTVLDEEVPEAEFRALLRSHAFVV